MSENVLGRMTPVGRTATPTPSKEGQQLLRVSLFHGCYPRHLITDKQKYKHLKSLYQAKEITKEVFTDLKGALHLKR
jgi:hypothetical protein